MLITKSRLTNEKIAEAKRAISSVWVHCLGNKYIEHSTKLKIFHSTSASILLNGAQVWGYTHFEEVEKFLRYFLKRIFRLPTGTPNYVLHLETTEPPLFLRTLKQHFKYILKGMEMDEERLPKKVLQEVILSRVDLNPVDISLKFHHFIARCPILKESWLRYFGVAVMEFSSTLDVLNGKLGWEILYNYTTTALKYRQLIFEGNF